MAKDFLSMQEACEMLGMTEDQVKALVQQGKLGEVRDGGKVYFRTAEVDKVASKEGSSVVDLEAADDAVPSEIELDDSATFASALSSLADSSASLGALDESPAPAGPPTVEAGKTAEDDTGSSIAFALNDVDESPVPGADQKAGGEEPAELKLEDIPEQLPAAPKAESTEEEEGSDLVAEIDLLPIEEGGTSDKAAVEDMPDLGLSGSSIISLEPGSDSSFTGVPGAKEGSKAGVVGISVFDDDEIEVDTDPMGETQISAAGVDEFDAVGSGSGLLDLTQENDGTSLGRELLDVISPSEEAAETEIEAEAIDTMDAETMADEEAGIAEVAPEEAVEATEAPTVRAATAAPRQVVAADTAGAVPMNVCLFTGLLGMAALGLATAGILQGAWPARILGFVDHGVVHWSVFGGLALAAIVTGVLSILAGRDK